MTPLAWADRAGTWRCYVLPCSSHILRYFRKAKAKFTARFPCTRSWQTKGSNGNLLSLLGFRGLMFLLIGVSVRGVPFVDVRVAFGRGLRPLHPAWSGLAWPLARCALAWACAHGPRHRQCGAGLGLGASPRGRGDPPGVLHDIEKKSHVCDEKSHLHIDRTPLLAALCLRVPCSTPCSTHTVEL